RRNILCFYITAKTKEKENKKKYYFFIGHVLEISIQIYKIIMKKKPIIVGEIKNHVYINQSI
ncbi:MAG TPA: hypothetical protein PKZ43_08565, partial [Bacteroidales bacterium]|nr:hypothetical protein [Bacteroidales bacterium]